MNGISKNHTLDYIKLPENHYRRAQHLNKLNEILDMGREHEFREKFGHGWVNTLKEIHNMEEADREYRTKFSDSKAKEAWDGAISKMGINIEAKPFQPTGGKKRKIKKHTKRHTKRHTKKSKAKRSRKNRKSHKKRK